MSHFLGQHLSERWFDKGSPDPVRTRVWAALRYVTIPASLIVVAILFERSAGGALLVGIGGGLAVSAGLNLLLLREKRTRMRDVLLVTPDLLRSRSAFTSFPSCNDPARRAAL